MPETVKEKKRTRICSRCKEEKPEDVEHFYKPSNRPSFRHICRECEKLRLREYDRKHQDKRKARNKRQSAQRRFLRKLYRALGEPEMEKVDLYRRALVDSSSTAETEEEKAAYFRGYIHGVRVQEEEAEVISSHKDLVFRIAAERRWIVPGYTFEDAVSAAWEGFLSVVRSRKERARPYIATAIRNKIIDDIRRKGSTWNIAAERGPHTLAIPVSSYEDEEGKTNLEAVSEDDGSSLHLSELTEDFLEEVASQDTKRAYDVWKLRLQGMTLKEVGERLGIGETRVCQIVNRTRSKDWAKEWAEKKMLAV